MAFITADRVKDTSTTTGTGSITVSGAAPTGYRTFSAVLSAGDTFYYCIQGQTTAEFEVGLGTYSSANVFARTTVLSSSNSGSAVSFSTGTKNVFITLAATKTLQIGPSSTPVAGSVPYGTGATLAYSAVGTANQVLTSAGAGAPTWSQVNAANLSGTVPIANGGTGLTSTPANGALDIGNGTDFTRTTLTAGTNIAITNGAGSIGIATSAAPSFATSVTSPLTIGGTTASSSLTLQSTSGVGTTDSILFKIGNNGATTAMTVNSSGLNVGASPNSATISAYSATNAAFLLQGDSTTQFSIGRFSTDTSSANISFRKYRGVAGTPTAVASGDQIMNVNFAAYGGTNLRNIANIVASVGTYTSDTDITGILRFGTSPSGAATPTERMRIDASGNVGVGTASPNASAIIDAQSTTKGVRFPNMTTTQKNAISSPAAGLVVFDTTLAKLCVYSGAAWETITSI